MISPMDLAVPVIKGATSRKARTLPDRGKLTQASMGSEETDENSREENNARHRNDNSRSASQNSGTFLH